MRVCLKKSLWFSSMSPWPRGLPMRWKRLQKMKECCRAKLRCCKRKIKGSDSSMKAWSTQTTLRQCPLRFRKQSLKNNRIFIWIKLSSWPSSWLSRRSKLSKWKRELFLSWKMRSKSSKTNVLKRSKKSLVLSSKIKRSCN